MQPVSIKIKSVAIVFLLTWLMSVLGLQCDSKTEKESEAVRFNRFAREAFKEVYPSLADQILTDYDIRNGVCFDIGCGPGYLGIEITKQSGLKVIGIDIDPDAVEIAQKNVKREKLKNRMIIEQGDVHRLRFADGSADLIVSRGSFLFWENIVQGFREIYRVLKPGGVAFVGGGMGKAISPEQKAVIKQKVEQAGFKDRCKNIIGLNMMLETMEYANIRDFKIIPDGPEDTGCPCGLWVEIRKKME